MFVSLWCDMREVGLVMQVAAVCVQVGTSDLKFDCPMVGLEAGWDNKPEGFYSQHWVYECIVTPAALVCAIHQFLVLSVVSFFVSVGIYGRGLRHQCVGAWWRW